MEAGEVNTPPAVPGVMVVARVVLNPTMTWLLIRTAAEEVQGQAASETVAQIRVVVMAPSGWPPTSPDRKSDMERVAVEVPVVRATSPEWEARMVADQEEPPRSRRSPAQLAAVAVVVAALTRPTVMAHLVARVS